MNNMYGLRPPFGYDLDIFIDGLDGYKINII